jgi:hypothetical protein
MTLSGITTCPHCGVDLERDLRDVFRKAEDEYETIIECQVCGGEINVCLSIVYNVGLSKSPCWTIVRLEDGVFSRLDPGLMGSIPIAEGWMVV